MNNFPADWVVATSYAVLEEDVYYDGYRNTMAVVTISFYKTCFTNPERSGVRIQILDMMHAFTPNVWGKT